MTNFFRHLFYSIITGIFLPCQIVSAQSVVNTESIRLDSIENGIKGNVELGFNLVQNINNVVQTQNSSHFQWSKAQHSLMSVNALNLTVFNDSKVLNDGFQYLRYSNSISTKLDIEVFGQAQYNTIINIKGRFLTGLGARFHLFNVDKDSVKLHFAAHYMREYEEETTDVINRHHRLNSIISFGWPISQKLSVNFIGYYQPDLLNFKDFRVSTEAGIDIQIFERFTLNYAMAWFYDENPPQGIRNIFYTFQNTLIFKI